MKRPGRAPRRALATARCCVLLQLLAVPAACVSSPSVRLRPAGAPAEETAALSWLWAPLEAGGLRPSRRQGHAAVEVGHQVYVIGGCDQDTQCFGDVHVLDTDTFQWRAEQTTAEGGAAPAARSGHSAVLVAGGIVVFGGANTEETLGDAHMLDLDTGRWEPLAVQGSSPGPRTNHAAAAGPHGRMYIFGGYDANGFFLNELWSLSVSRGAAADGRPDAPVASWELVVPVGAVPAAREGHTLTAVERRLVLFGGFVAGAGPSNDVHVFDPATRVWSRLQVGGALPPPRQAHAAARHGSSLVVSGGCDTSVSQPVCFPDVWSLSLEDATWTQRSAGYFGWPAREGHTSTFVRGRMFMFGGCRLAGDCYDDVVALDTSEPCPFGCGGHGTCVGQQFCQCSEAGFTGHDCMQPLSCRQDCGLHGACSQSGECVCDRGWSGPGCVTQEIGAGLAGPSAPGGRCPHDCCGRGECTRDGCRCSPGWFGPMCTANETMWGRIRLLEGARARRQQASKSQALADSMSRAIASGVPQPASVWVQMQQLQADARALLEAALADEREALPSSDPRFIAAVKESLECQPVQSGVANLATPGPTHAPDVPHEKAASNSSRADASLGQTGALRSRSRRGDLADDLDLKAFSRGCGPDICNNKGVCRDDVCFCQTGFTGEQCEIRNKSKKNTVPLGMGATLILSLGFISCLLSFIGFYTNHWLKKKNKEDGKADQGGDEYADD